MPWSEEYHKLKNAGFEDLEIEQEAVRKREAMSEGGFESKEIDDYFGVKEPDMAPVKELIESNIKAAQEKEPDKEHDFFDKLSNAFFSGMDNSSGYMAVQAMRGKPVTPDDILPEDAGTFFRIVSQASTIAGDLPAMVVGGIAGGAAGGALGGAAGGAAGSVVPVAGTAVGAAAGGITLGALGAGAGANAAPEALRSSLMQYYEKGEITNFRDFWERTSSVFMDTAKAGAIGAVTMGVGGKVAGALVSRGAAPVVSRVASAGSEVATMVTMGSVLEGEMPKAQDFLDGALLVGALHGVTKVTAATGKQTATKLREMYAKTGMKPEQIIEEAKTNPVLRQQLLIDGDQVPGLTGEVSSLAKKPATLMPDAPKPAAEPFPAQDTILSKVGEKTVKTKPGYDMNDFYKDYVDRLDPINTAVKELKSFDGDLPANQDPYKLFRMANDFKAKTKHMVEKGVLDFATLEQTGKPLLKILEPVKSDINGFKAYLISKRAMELEARGIKSGFDPAAAAEVVKAGETKFKTAAKEIVEYQNGVLKYLKDSGVLDQKSFDNIVEVGKNYVSFKRISEEGSVSKGGKAGKAIKAIKGSELSIQDPFTSIIENTEHYTKLAEKNRAVLSLVELAEKNPEQTLFKKVEAVESKATKAAPTADGDMTPAVVEAIRDNSKTLSAERFEVFKDGKKIVYETEPAIAEAIRSLEGNATAMNMAMKMAQSITKVKRTMISVMPDFIFRNFFKDQFTAATFSKNGTMPFWDTVVAAGDILKKNDHYYNWLKAGGANGSFLEMGDTYAKANIYELNKSTSVIDKTWNVAKKPYQFLEAAGSLAEQATRLAEAKRVMGKETSGARIFEAGIASRDATIDFQRVGAKVSALNSITAFMNAGIQGTDRIARAFKENPKEASLRAGMYITAPSLLLWWANKDDERVKELPRWQKDTFWIIATDNWEAEDKPGQAEMLPPHLVRPGKNGIPEINKGVIFRVPKPPVLGQVFGSIPERVMEKYLGENPEAMEDFGSSITDMIAPNLIPDAVSPLAEQWANKSNFTKSKLVPAHLEGVLPEYQYTDYTTDTAKALGKMIGAVPFIGNSGSKNAPTASPMVIENYVKSWTGSTGMYAMQLADKALQAVGATDVKNKPAATLNDIPVIKAFVVRHPSASGESLEKFNKRFEENQKYISSFKYLNKVGEMGAAQELRMNPEHQIKFQELSGIHEAIKNQSRFIQSVYRNPEMDKHEKRQLIDSVYYQMTETAKMGMQAIREFEQITKQQKEKK